MPSYILRNIDPKLWERVKTRAQKDDLPLRALILAMLKAYADGRLELSQSEVEINPR